MRFSILIISTLLLSAFAANSSLSIISPHSLANEFEDGQLDFALSHYGDIPYGTHLTGRLVIIHPVEGCSEIDLINPNEEVDIVNPIAIVSRGGCRVAIKARNAQRAGAKAVIIIDNQDKETLHEWFGHEHGADDIHIPTLLIKKVDGERIKTFINNKLLVNPDFPGVLVSINFSHDKEQNSQLDYWYNSADRYGSSILFLQQFYDYWQRNNNVIRFLPHIVTWTCAECKKGNFKDGSNKDCLAGGRYCSPDPDEEGPLTGADVVREDLRQMCVIRQQEKLWWEYTIAVGQACKDELNECGDKILRDKASSEMYNRVMRCIKESFDGDELIDDNSVLKESKRLQLEYAINQYPVLFINNKPFYGRLNRAHLVFEELCRNLEPLPEDCKIALTRTGEATYTKSQTHVGRIVVFVIVMLIVSVFCVFYCRRMMKKENKDMSLEVGSMVNRYFSVKDSA